jgi:hypothetical protein
LHWSSACERSAKWFNVRPVKLRSPGRFEIQLSPALSSVLGLSPELLFDSVLDTPIVAPFLASKRDKIDNRNYEAEFPLRWMQKDMHLAALSAFEAGVAMPLTNVAKEIYRLAMRDGHATDDFSAIYEFVSGNEPFPPASSLRSSVLVSN